MKSIINITKNYRVKCNDKYIDLYPRLFDLPSFDLWCLREDYIREVYDEYPLVDENNDVIKENEQIREKLALFDCFISPCQPRNEELGKIIQYFDKLLEEFQKSHIR